MKKIIQKELSKVECAEGLTIDDIKLNSDLGCDIIKNIVYSLIESGGEVKMPSIEEIANAISMSCERMVAPSWEAKKIAAKEVLKLFQSTPIESGKSEREVLEEFRDYLDSLPQGENEPFFIDANIDNYLSNKPK